MDGSDSGTFHVNIDKNAKVQAAVVAAIAALARSSSQVAPAVLPLR